jgi:lipid II:glycine glycyltransferase (peptidoglycan interpeptide bridge formation enzyme)
MILSKRFSVRILDLYFDEQPPSMRVDILRFNQSPTPVPGSVYTPFSTIVIDLSPSQDELLGRMKIHHRQKIRRAFKDDLTYEYSRSADPAAISRFADHFDACAKLKNLPLASRERLAILAEQNALDISWASSNGTILSACCAVIAPARIRGLYAASSFRSNGQFLPRTLIGRAGRYLYWRDILRFKEMGATHYDLGGYYTGTVNAERLRVNEFKEGFGGEIRHEFNCELGVTLKGKLVGWAIRQRNERIWRKRNPSDIQGGTQEHQYESAVPTAV